MFHISSHASAHNTTQKPAPQCSPGRGGTPERCQVRARTALTPHDVRIWPDTRTSPSASRREDQIPPPDVGCRAPGAERRRPDVGPRSAWPLKRRGPAEPPSAASAVGGRADARAVVLHPHADDLHTRSTQGSLSTSTGSDEMMARAAGAGATRSAELKRNHTSPLILPWSGITCSTMGRAKCKNPSNPEPDESKRKECD